MVNTQLQPSYMNDTTYYSLENYREQDDLYDLLRLLYRYSMPTDSLQEELHHCIQQEEFAPPYYKKEEIETFKQWHVPKRKLLEQTVDDFVRALSEKFPNTPHITVPLSEIEESTVEKNIKLPENMEKKYCLLM